MAKGIDIINLFGETVNNQDPGLWQKVQVQAANAQMQIHDLHARAIGCHCECMGMNSENMLAAIANQSPPYNDKSYFQVMRKWGLIDDGNNPII